MVIVNSAHFHLFLVFPVILSQAVNKGIGFSERTLLSNKIGV